ncbi:MAG: ABC transporter ATP-binding protein [Candidatus Omnitrophota bacterium]
MSEVVIELKNVSKRYSVNFSRRSLLHNVLALFRKANTADAVWAAKDINISVKQGEALGIIGENASGKTTILRIISGITVPTSGSVKVQGKVAGLLDLGAGFPPELTGRECIYLNAALFGLRRKQIDVLYADIVRFSGLEKFIDAQVKTYSQGMLVRLGFSVAVHIDPDIFLIDDTLAVGDEEFQRKCLKKVAEFQQRGKTVVIVSHDLNSISRVCKQGILLKDGSIVKEDSMQKVIIRYIEAVGNKESIACIDQNRLSIIFNSGRIIILWDGKPVTKNFGGYLGLQMRERWAMSWEAEWNIQDSGRDYLKARGIWHKEGIKADFEINVEQDYILHWRVVVEAPEFGELKNVALGLMVAETYSHYLNSDSIEEIKPEQIITGKWQDLYRTDEISSLLVLTSVYGLPGIAGSFDKKNYKGFGLIQATDKELNSRVMLTQFALPENKHRKSNILECRADIHLLENEQIDLIVDQQRQKLSIQAENIEIKLKDRKFQILYSGCEITKNNGFNFGLRGPGYYLNIFDGSWDIKKDGDKALKIASEFSNLNLNIILCLKINSNVIDWDLTVENSGGIVLDSLEMEIFLSEKYEHYFDIAGEKEFSAVPESNEEIELIESKCGIVGLSGDGKGLPFIVLEKEQNSQVELQNARFDVNARILYQKTPLQNTSKGRMFLLSSQREKDEFIIRRQKTSELDTVLSNDKLHVDFSRNKLKVCWDNREITSGEGLSSGIFFKGRWYESTQIAKEFKKDGDELKIIIKRRIPYVNEFWTIKLHKQRIFWAVELESFENITDFIYKAGLLLKPEFTQWVHSFDSGDFAEHNTIDNDDSNNILLGARPNDSQLPALLFEKKDADTAAGIIIQNSDSCRLMQFKSKASKQVFCGEISFLKEGELDGKINQYRLRNFTLTTDKAQLFIGSKKAVIFSNDKPLTTEDGLRISMVTDQGDFETQNAFWHVKMDAPDSIGVKLTWGNGPFELEWNFSEKDGDMLWRVYLKPKCQFKLKECVVSILTNSSFNHWISRAEEGVIEFSSGDSPSVAIFDNRSDFIGIYQDKISDGNPALIFNPLVDMNEWFIHIVKYYVRKELIGCGAHWVIDPQGMMLKNENLDVFSGRLLLVENRNDLSRIEMSDKYSKVVQINRDKLTIKVEKAKVRLFWGSQELTKTLCLYTSFSHARDWIDSTLAKWQVVTVPNGVDIALCWDKVFTTHKWQLRLTNEREIMWKVVMDINQPEINSAAVSLMLCEGYDFCQSREKGEMKFPDQFADDHWNQLSSGGEKVAVFSKKKVLPGICFDGKFEAREYLNVVENTDLRHASRVLKCRTTITDQDKKGKEPVLFTGKISLEG